MYTSSVYKVITLKELIKQVYEKKTGFPSKACISLAKFLYCSAIHPDAKQEKDGPKSAFKDFLEAHDYFMAYANYIFVAEQTQTPNTDSCYTITLTRDGKRKPDFKIINTFKLW